MALEEDVRRIGIWHCRVESIPLEVQERRSAVGWHIELLYGLR